VDVKTIFFQGLNTTPFNNQALTLFAQNIPDTSKRMTSSLPKSMMIKMNEKVITGTVYHSS
jgi:hypothetical protein